MLVLNRNASAAAQRAAASDILNPHADGNRIGDFFYMYHHTHNELSSSEGHTRHHFLYKQRW